MEPTPSNTEPASRRPPARVSILLPVRNAASTLASCLKSLTRQTETDWQCVAVNDGSSDASGKLLESAAALDDRIEVIHTPPKGLVAALTCGLKQCQAPLVARMDADDWMHRERLQLQCDWLDAKPNDTAVGTWVRVFPRNEKLREGRRLYEDWLNGLSSAESIAQNAFVECPIAHPTLTIRTSTLRALGYRDMGWPEDYDLILRLLAGGHRLAVLPRRLLGWRDQPHRLSRRSQVYDLDRFAQCKAAHLSDGFLKGNPEYWLWGFGSTGRRLQKAILEFGHAPCHIIDLHPRRLGQRIHGALVIHPDEIVSLERRPLVVSVSGQKARSEIRNFLTSLSFVETEDYVFAA